MYDFEEATGMTQELVEEMARNRPPVFPQRDTTRPYPPEGTVVSALSYGVGHWCEGPVTMEGGKRRIDCGKPHDPIYLEDAAHWYVPEGQATTGGTK